MASGSAQEPAGAFQPEDLGGGETEAAAQDGTVQDGGGRAAGEAAEEVAPVAKLDAPIVPSEAAEGADGGGQRDEASLVQDSGATAASAAAGDVMPGDDADRAFGVNDSENLETGQPHDAAASSTGEEVPAGEAVRDTAEDPRDDELGAPTAASSSVEPVAARVDAVQDADIALEAGSDAAVPTRFDAREQGWIGTLVRQQNPWGSCWAISALQVMEANLVKQGKLQPGQLLSARHLLMFAGTALPSDPAAAAALVTADAGLASSGAQPGQLAAQAGEGQHAVDWLVERFGDNAPFELGGNFYVVYQAIASGVGPIFEQAAPYRNDEGIVEYGEEASWYAPEGTWSLPQGMRFASVLQLDEAIRLTSPARYASPQGTSTYAFDGQAVQDIKLAVMEYGSVALAIDSSSSYYDKAHNTVFTTESRLDNHGVQIVGWDDTVSRELFTTGGDGSLPEGDGAWIVRNSWGAPGQDFPNRSAWSADGYFLLSYYDRSAQAFSAYRVSSAAGDRATDIINQYDFLGQMGQASARITDSNLEFMSANVFTAETRQQLQAVSVDTYAADSDVTIEVYRLSAGATAPDQGELLERLRTTIAQAGYHRVPLQGAYILEKGERFSVVERVLESTAEGGALAVASIEAGNSREAAELYGYYHYDTVVANPGESFLYTSLVDGEALRWVDATEVGAALTARSSVATPYGNVCIKAFSRKLAEPNPEPAPEPTPSPQPQPASLPDLTPVPSAHPAGSATDATGAFQQGNAKEPSAATTQALQAVSSAKSAQASAHAIPPTGDEVPSCVLLVLVVSFLLLGASATKLSRC